MSFKGERDGIPLVKSADFYLNNPPRQPKLEVANYVEANGILVPRRFANLDQALSSGKPFIVRSEHPQEYAGVSGLLRSYEITLEQIRANKAEFGSGLKEIDWNYVFGNPDENRRFDAKNQIIAQLGNLPQDRFEDNLKRLSTLKIGTYCRLKGISPEKLSSEISYSYWELMGGVNKTIVADSGVSGRYHIFAMIPNTDYNFSYSVIENGKVKTNISYLLNEADEALLSAVSIYESIRNLGHFDKNQCPLVEMQTVGDKNYFLQYHRGTDTSPSQFKLERGTEEGEIKAIFVRGAALKEGITVKLNLHSPGKKALVREDGALDDPVLSLFTELMVRRRKLQVITAENMKDFVSKVIDNGHLSKSTVFKPLISVVLEDKKVSSLFGDTSQVLLRVVSDGTSAYIKKIG